MKQTLIALFSLFFLTNDIHGQQDEFAPLDKSNFIILSYQIYDQQLVIKVDQLPEAMEWSRMMICKTNGDFILGCEVRESGQMCQLVNHSRDYHVNDFI